MVKALRSRSFNTVEVEVELDLSSYDSDSDNLNNTSLAKLFAPTWVNRVSLSVEWAVELCLPFQNLTCLTLSLGEDQKLSDLWRCLAKVSATLKTCNARDITYLGVHGQRSQI